MKANHVPVADRLRNRIDKLSSRIRHGDHWTSRRFYPQCIYCGITIVSSNMSGGGHHGGCPVPGTLKEIAHYRRLLARATGTPTCPDCGRTTNQLESVGEPGRMSCRVCLNDYDLDLEIKG